MGEGHSAASDTPAQAAENLPILDPLGIDLDAACLLVALEQLFAVAEAADVVILSLPSIAAGWPNTSRTTSIDRAP